MGSARGSLKDGGANGAVVPVIMAGGAGARLWPLSRALHPKQFLNLSGDATMLCETVHRLAGLDCAAPVVVCNEEHRFLAAEQMRQSDCDAAAILLEPEARGTAPALAIAARAAMHLGDDPIILALAADHVIADEAAFHRSLAIATRAAADGKLVTFGVVPQGVETGYGYIETGGQVGEAIEVVRFVEKPDRAAAERYGADGRHLWNSGMFVFRASRFLDELAVCRPDIHDACLAATAAFEADRPFLRIDGGVFADCPSESVDCAVMEKTCDAVVVPLEAGWSDVGTWSALWNVREKDACGNVLSGDVIAERTNGSLVHSEHRLVVALGLRDLVIVETKDAVLAAHRDAVGGIKHVVRHLQAAGRPEPVENRVVCRPWGRYDLIDSGDRHRVKRITVDPGAKLSIQMHRHRSEHWVVVRGTARVYKDGETLRLAENESIFIPIGTVHALENPGDTPLELIEVQTGDYLGEDDIVRFEDRYGRR